MGDLLFQLYDDAGADEFRTVWRGDDRVYGTLLHHCGDSGIPAGRKDLPAAELDGDSQSSDCLGRYPGGRQYISKGWGIISTGHCYGKGSA